MMWAAQYTWTNSSNRIRLDSSEGRVRVETGPGWTQVSLDDLRRDDLQAIRDACERGIKELDKEQGE